jgi:2-phosphoglycolate phosphatase
MSRLPLVLFDLDGTLIDSAPDLAGAANAMRAARGLAPMPLAALRPMVGSGARGMVGLALGVGPADAGYDDLRIEFLDRYAQALLVHTAVFDAMVPVLDQFDAEGRAWGIVTNKAERFAHPIVQGLGLQGRAAVLICGDTTPHSKPHPEPLLEAARRLSVEPSACAYVGDDARDVQAGRAAGMVHGDGRGGLRDQGARRCSSSRSNSTPAKRPSARPAACSSWTPASAWTPCSATAQPAGGGFFGKLLGAGKRLVTGESLFTTVYTNNAAQKQRVAFAAPYPGKILPMDLRQLGGMLICQKDAFLCAARGVSLGIYLQQKLSVGFFGGEGFIMQKLEGDGLAFVHAGGTVVKRELQPGQTLMVDTGCVVAYTPNVNFEIQYVGKIKTALFGGEGLFFAKAHRPRHRVAAEPAVLAPGLAGVCRGAAARRLRAKRARCWAACRRRPAGRHPGRRRRRVMPCGRAGCRPRRAYTRGLRLCPLLPSRHVRTPCPAAPLLLAGCCRCRPRIRAAARGPIFVLNSLDADVSVIDPVRYTEVRASPPARSRTTCT